MNIDYQVTPELSEQMLNEFLESKRPTVLRRLLFPLVLAACFASFAAGGCKGHLIIMDQDYPRAAIASNIIEGAAAGFGLGLLSNLFVRGRIKTIALSRVRTGPAGALRNRAFSFDEMGISFASPVWRYEWKWTAVDRIFEGAIGIHFLWKDQLLCSIPKRVFPSEVSGETLRDILRRYSPPLMANQHLQETPR